jgi:hypothetical protein
MPHCTSFFEGRGFTRVERGADDQDIMFFADPGQRVPG